MSVSGHQLPVRRVLLCSLLLLLCYTTDARHPSVKRRKSQNRELATGSNIFVEQGLDETGSYGESSKSDSEGKAGKGGKGGKGKKKKVGSLLSHGKGKAGKAGGFFGYGKVNDWLGVGKGKKQGPKYGFNADGSKCVYRQYATSFSGPPKLKKPMPPSSSPAPPKVSVLVGSSVVKKTKAPTAPTVSPAPTITPSPTKAPKFGRLLQDSDFEEKKTKSPSGPESPSSKSDKVAKIYLGDDEYVYYPYCTPTRPNSPSSPSQPTGNFGGEPPSFGSPSPGSPTAEAPSAGPPSTPSSPSSPTSPSSPSVAPPVGQSPSVAPPTDESPSVAPPTDGSPSPGDPDSPTANSPTVAAPTGGLEQVGDLCTDIGAGNGPTDHASVQFNIAFEMSLTGDEDQVIPRFEEFLQQRIATLLAGCTRRRRLQGDSAEIRNVVFNVEKDATKEPFCSTCVNLDVETDIYYEGSDTSEFRELLYNAILAECEAIRSLEGVDEALNPCLDLVITGPIDNDFSDGFETFEGDPNTDRPGVAGATRQVDSDGGLTAIGGLAVALGGLILVLLAVLFARKQQRKDSTHMKHQYLDDADFNFDDDTDEASTNPSPVRGVAFDGSQIEIVSNNSFSPNGSKGSHELDESIEVPSNPIGNEESKFLDRLALPEQGSLVSSLGRSPDSPGALRTAGTMTVLALNEHGNEDEPSISSHSWPSALTGPSKGRQPRLSHVVGEENSVMSNWSFFNKNKLSPQDNTAEGNEAMRSQDKTDVHKCSSATCEICEARRQSGLQFIPVAMPGYSHESLQADSESKRVYLAEDTVQL